MVQHTKGSGTHVPGLSESVGRGPPLLFRQPLNRHLKWGRLPARDPSRPFLSDGLPPFDRQRQQKKKFQHILYIVQAFPEALMLLSSHITSSKLSLRSSTKHQLQILSKTRSKHSPYHHKPWAKDLDSWPKFSMNSHQTSVSISWANFSSKLLKKLQPSSFWSFTNIALQRPLTSIE